MPRRKNETDYCDLSKRSHRGKSLEDSHGLPSSEARGLLPLLDAGYPPEAIRELIRFPAHARAELRAAGVPGWLVSSAIRFRQDVLAEFDRLVYLAARKSVAARPCTRKSLVPWSRRRRPNVKIIDMLRPRTQAPEANSQVDGRDALDILGEERVCWSCGRLPSVQVLDGHGFCRLCFPAEMHARSAAS